MPPSGTPLKLQILSAIETALTGISGGSDYYTDVALVTRAQPVATEVREYPAIVVTPEKTSYELPTQTTESVNANYEIRLTLIVRTRDDAVTAIENMVRDVHKALIADESLGGLATYVTLLEDASLYPTDIDEPIAISELLVSVKYRALRTDLNQET